jgi:hypothetical protein
MSRELKFRSWNLETKFMYKNIEDGVVAKNQKDEFVLGISFGAICRDANSIVMQFTGLTDTNGIEIYEGDILDNKWVISFKNGMFGIFNENTYMGFNSYMSQFRKVIGNIYENPELMQS